MIITDDAQFGINPIKSASNGWNIELETKNLAILSSPTISKNEPRSAFTIKIYNVIFKL